MSCDDLSSFEPCPYTLSVAGPSKPIPTDAPLLPIRVRERLSKELARQSVA